jgi:hypothetical protein
MMMCCLLMGVAIQRCQVAPYDFKTTSIEQVHIYRDLGQKGEIQKNKVVHIISKVQINCTQCVALEQSHTNSG